MPDATQTTGAEGTAAGTTATATQADTIDKKKYDELAGRYGSTLQKLEALEKAQKELADKSLAEKGQYKEIAEKQKIELDALVGVKAKADEQEKVIAKLLQDHAEGVDKIVADAIIDNPKYSLDEKIEKIKAVKTGKRESTNSPASETPGVAGYKNPEELFAKIKSDMGAQVALSVDNPKLFDQFKKWRTATA